MGRRGPSAPRDHWLTVRGGSLRGDVRGVGSVRQGWRLRGIPPRRRGLGARPWSGDQCDLERCTGIRPMAFAGNRVGIPAPQRSRMGVCGPCRYPNSSVLGRKVNRGSASTRMPMTVRCRRNWVSLQSLWNARTGMYTHRRSGDFRRTPLASMMSSATSWSGRRTVGMKTTLVPRPMGTHGSREIALLVYCGAAGGTTHLATSARRSAFGFRPRAGRTTSGSGLPGGCPDSAYSHEVVHPFRAKPSGCSGASRPPIPPATTHALPPPRELTVLRLAASRSPCSMAAVWRWPTPGQWKCCSWRVTGRWPDGLEGRARARASSWRLRRWSRRPPAFWCTMPGLDASTNSPKPGTSSPPGRCPARAVLQT